ncbi:DUF3775 domain-containing protein [Magnetovibrio blakemorei]|uniref:DUF3775 domain-containing protein n=1 Tax=Magnetovibrio blakemorei TaxID=28181 RepID=A0A1E5Q9X0_9PROT|nr:DUF3775 domain-containing protein [Magnetovibrio blakemorei]OEJ68516.1 hypothetical protein BEN30_06210 [Magnetovibrio blakemorei]
MQAISSEKVCFVIVKSREFDAKEDAPYEDPGGNASDDGDHQILSHQPDDSVYEELVSFFESLSDEELCELHAMVMLGRGDVDMEGWDEAVQTAQDDLDENTPKHLLEIPLISDYLAEALSQFGCSCSD